jgi:hypothetical protein
MKQLSPRRVVCLQCSACLGFMRWDRSEVEKCKGDTCKTGLCPFYPFRLGKRIPVKAFRFFCIHCMGGQSGLIIDCPSTACKVYPYRMGKNPSRLGIGNYGARIGREFVKTDQELMI